MKSPDRAQVPDLLTPGEVMRRLNVSRKTVDRYRRSGSLPAIKLPGGHARFRREDVEAIERGEVPA